MFEELGLDFPQPCLDTRPDYLSFSDDPAGNSSHGDIWPEKGCKDRIDGIILQ